MAREQKLPEMSNQDLFIAGIAMPLVAVIGAIFLPTFLFGAVAVAVIYIAMAFMFFAGVAAFAEVVRRRKAHQ